MNAKRITDRTAVILLLSLSAMTASHAFVAPSPSQRISYQRSSTSLDALPETNPLLLADGLSAATRWGGNNDFSSLSGSVSGPLSTLRTFFIVITASVFGITAVAYLTAAFLVPKAAEQLERDTKRLRPGLWEEYEAKLQDEESMVNRPDLLQELGNVMQPIIVKEYENDAAVKFDGNNISTSANGGSASSREQGDAIDVTIEKSDK